MFSIDRPRTLRDVAAWLLASAGGLVLVAAAGYLLIHVIPEWAADAVPPDDAAEERRSVRTAALATIAGLIAVVGAVYTSRNFALNRRGQLTERFTRAIAQLGETDKLDVRLGGIYALERLAQESREEHAPIMEVLTAYVRNHAPVGDAEERVTRPGVDVQAIITILTRRRLAHEEPDGVAIDLQDTSLARVRASRLHAPGCNLARADLRRSGFRGADLHSAFAADANWSDALLAETNLRGAWLAGINGRGASFIRADLRDARLIGADLTGANLLDVDARGASLEGVDLRDAILEGARLEGADLRNANLAAADLSGASYDANTRWPEAFDVQQAGTLMRR